MKPNHYIKPHVKGKVNDYTREDLLNVMEQELGHFLKYHILKVIKRAE